MRLLPNGLYSIGTLLFWSVCWTKQGSREMGRGTKENTVPKQFREHTIVDGFCSYCLCLERDKDLLACMTMAEAKKAFDEAEPVPFTKSEINNMVDFVLHGPGGP